MQKLIMRSKSNLQDLISSMQSQSDFRSNLGRDSYIAVPKEGSKKIERHIEVFDEMLDESGSSDGGNLKRYLQAPSDSDNKLKNLSNLLD